MTDTQLKAAICASIQRQPLRIHLTRIAKAMGIKFEEPPK